MLKARDYIPVLKQGGKIVLDDLESGGVLTFGNVYWVDATNGSDTNDGLTKDTAFATIATAYAAVTSGNHDVIMLSANAAHAQTSMLSITKSRVHFIAADFRGGSYGLGARARVTMGVTTAATDIAVMQNTGVGNTFTGIKFDSSNTKAESLYAVAEGGEYSIYRGCEFYKSTDLDVTGAAEVLNNGDSAQWINCTFGSTANAISGAIIRPCMLVTRETITGKVCRDNVIDSCLFLRKAGNVANRFIYGANANDVERMMLILGNTVFFSNPLGAATPALAIDFGAAQTDGAVYVGPTVGSVDVTALGATGEGVYTLAPDSPTYATAGIAVAS